MPFLKFPRLKIFSMPRYLTLGQWVLNPVIMQQLSRDWVSGTLWPSLRNNTGPFFLFLSRYHVFQLHIWEICYYRKDQTKWTEDHPFGFDTEKDIYGTSANCLYYRSRKILDSYSRERGLMAHLGNLPCSVSMESRASFLLVPQS